MSLGRLLVAAGLALLLGGVIVMLAERVPFLSWMGRLPGDIRIGSGRTRFVFPLATCLVLSLVLTVLLRAARFLLLRL